MSKRAWSDLWIGRESRGRSRCRGNTALTPALSQGERVNGGGHAGPPLQGRGFPRAAGDAAGGVVVGVVDEGADAAGAGGGEGRQFLPGVGRWVIRGYVADGVLISGLAAEGDDAAGDDGGGGGDVGSSEGERGERRPGVGGGIVALQGRLWRFGGVLILLTSN